MRGMKAMYEAKYSQIGSTFQRNSIINERENTNNVAKAQLLKALGYKVLADINSVSVVMPTALVGTVILTLRGRVSVSRLEFVFLRHLGLTLY